jgi:hypothetical protein
MGGTKRTTVDGSAAMIAARLKHFQTKRRPVRDGRFQLPRITARASATAEEKTIVGINPLVPCRTQTSTTLRPPEFETCASTASATSAPDRPNAGVIGLAPGSVPSSLRASKPPLPVVVAFSHRPRAAIPPTANNAFNLRHEPAREERMIFRLFKSMTGVDMLHVPYRGAAPALIDLLGGQVQVVFDTMAPSIEHIRAGTVRALAVTSATRVEVLPEILTIGDFVPGYEASRWYGLCAPKNTPAEIIGKLSMEINAGLADPGMKARIAEFGDIVFASSRADFESSSSKTPRSGAR